MKINKKKIKKFFKKLPLKIAEHAFSASIFLSLLAIVFAGLLLYKYTNLAKKAEAEQQDQSFILKKNIYQEVLVIWQENEQKFQQADSKQYPNPFISSQSELTE